MIHQIFIAPDFRSAQKTVSQVQLKAGLGIVGDRNFGKSQHPGQNITFIEKEAIDAYNADHDQSIGPDATRRNIITKDVHLNELVGKTFKIGDVEFFGVELCQPCSKLGSDLTNATMSDKDVIKAFLDKGGLRANVLTDGHISVGMNLSLLNP